MEESNNKYAMTLDLNVLNHLGLNLYSNTPSVLSEAVANSYDADATEVNIFISDTADAIEIIDNGKGMSIDDLNNKFLCVGYQKRASGEALSEIFKRPVMGRKGIGKLSLLSIADVIEVHSVKEGYEGNALKLSKASLEATISDKNKVYNPEEIAFVPFDHKSGTKIIIKKLRNNINRTESYLRPRLGKRFSLKSQGANKFDIKINNKLITLEDRNFFNKVDFIWYLDELDPSLEKYSNIKKKIPLGQPSKDPKFKLSGWLATVSKPSDLQKDNDNNNKISILCRGKLAQEDILSFFNEGGIYSNYIIGEIHADFLDMDNAPDIATSNRQQLNENDERFQTLQGYIYGLLKTLQRNWTELRNENAVLEVTQQIPELKEWYNSYSGDTQKYAKKLFATIDSLHFDNDVSKKKEIFKFGILAFERLRVADKLSELESLTPENISQFGSIFSSMQDIEAALYYDIASQRVGIIQKISDCCDNNEKEKVLQEHLFENLWLLDASWERATDGSQRMEQSVTKEFDSITSKLSDEESRGRIDIRYKTSANKHIIIELKRYVTSYKVTKGMLIDQVDKYIKALRKCLVDAGEANPYIEAICVLGPNTIEDINDANESMKASNARIITYDLLIEHALNSYKDYLDKNKEIGKIRKIIDKL